MNNTNAIVIIYNGKPLKSPVTAAQLAVTLVNLGIIEDTDHAVIQARDIDGITNSLIDGVITESVSDAVEHAKHEKDDEATAIESAMILIGKMFAESLKEGKETGNYSKFATQLCLQIKDDLIAKAIKTLATSSGKIRKEIISRYKITPGALEVVRGIYNSFLL